MWVIEEINEHQYTILQTKMTVEKLKRLRTSPTFFLHRKTTEFFWNILAYDIRIIDMILTVTMIDGKLECSITKFYR